MEDITWTVTEPDGTVKIHSKSGKVPYCEPFEITEKTPKNQLYTIKQWNLMRDKLLELREMEEK